MKSPRFIKFRQFEKISQPKYRRTSVWCPSAVFVGWGSHLEHQLFGRNATTIFFFRCKESKFLEMESCECNGVDLLMGHLPSWLQPPVVLHTVELKVTFDGLRRRVRGCGDPPSPTYGQPSQTAYRTPSWRQPSGSLSAVDNDGMDTS